MCRSAIEGPIQQATTASPGITPHERLFFCASPARPSKDDPTGSSSPWWQCRPQFTASDAAPRRTDPDGTGARREQKFATELARRGRFVYYCSRTRRNEELTRPGETTRMAHVLPPSPA